MRRLARPSQLRRQRCNLVVRVSEAGAVTDVGGVVHAGRCAAVRRHWRASGRSERPSWTARGVEDAPVCPRWLAGDFGCSVLGRRSVSVYCEYGAGEEIGGVAVEAVAVVVVRPGLRRRCVRGEVLNVSESRAEVQRRRDGQVTAGVRVHEQ